MHKRKTGAKDTHENDYNSPVDSEDIFELRHRASRPPLKKIPVEKFTFRRFRGTIEQNVALTMARLYLWPFQILILPVKSLTFRENVFELRLWFCLAENFPRWSRDNIVVKHSDKIWKGREGGRHTAQGVSSFSSATRFDSRCREMMAASNRVRCCKGGEEKGSGKDVGSSGCR